MVARSEIVVRTVEDAPEICLMLSSKVGECSGDGGESRVYSCKICMKEFSSFQALGGHRASHKKPVNTSRDEQSSPSSESVRTELKKTKSHTCPICGVEFPLGQALGGHMRKHRKDKDSGGALVTRSLFPEATITTTLKKSSSGKRVACLDLMESTINLKLELGRTNS